MNWGRVFHSGRVTKMRNQVFVFATLFACGAIVSTFLRSQERTLSVSDPLQFVRGSSDVQTRNDAAILDGWIEKVENGW